MTNKIFKIPIEAPEALAQGFVELICLAKGFQRPTEVSKETGESVEVELTDTELLQLKLNFVGQEAGKHLREVAEYQKTRMAHEALRKEQDAENTAVAGAFVIKDVEVE